MTPPRIRLRYRIEHAGLRGADALANHLPPALSERMAVAAAALAHFVIRFRVRDARRRIRAVCGPECSARDVRRIAWRSWRNLALSSMDMLRSGSLTLDWMEQHANLDDLRRHLDRLRDGPRGAVIACAHFGSWELAGVACRRLGLPIFAIAAPQRNPLFNEWMIGLRARAGIDTLLRNDSDLIRHVVRRLKKGQFLAILPDVRVAAGGIPVPFLGAEAQIGPGMALFARLADVPILPSLPYRRPDGRHEIHIADAVRPDPRLDRDADMRRMTLAVMQTIEAGIRREPHQWFWYNKRWILDPAPPAS